MSYNLFLLDWYAGANLPNMSEASSYSIDIAKMRNALLSSVSSRFNCYGNSNNSKVINCKHFKYLNSVTKLFCLIFFGNSGNDEAQFEILEGSMHMNDLM